MTAYNPRLSGGGESAAVERRRLPPYTQPSQPPPPTGGGGGGYTPPPPGPQPRDFNEGGKRFDPNTGQWLDPNFFSDLGGGGGGGQPGGGGAPSPAGIPAPPGQSPMTPGGPLVQPQSQFSPGGYSGIELPEQLLEYIPENLRSQFAAMLPQFMGQYGYQGLGNVGRYGERSFGRPGGAGPIGFTPEQFNFFTDPTMRSWFQWLFGERGFAPRVGFPGQR